MQFSTISRTEKNDIKQNVILEIQLEIQISKKLVREIVQAGVINYIQ